MREHFEVRDISCRRDCARSNAVNAQVNTVGVLALFQATYPLLKASTPAPKFVPISSGAGSVAMSGTIPMYNTPYVPASPMGVRAAHASCVGRYGTSKAALNFVTRKLRAENDGLGASPAHPRLLCAQRTPVFPQYASPFAQASSRPT
jgi:NAD(P)-dependent dehydrogenase (short-subunit alcohol dehydrogenase family)